MPLIFHLPPLPAAGRLEVRQGAGPGWYLFIDIYLTISAVGGIKNCFSGELAIVKLIE